MHRCSSCGSAYLDPRPTAEAIHLAYRQYHTHAVAPTPRPIRSPNKTDFFARAVNGYLNARYRTRLQPATSSGRWLLPFLVPLRQYLDARARHIPPSTHPPGRILDVGCGSGDFLAFAAEAGWIAEGVDIDEEAVDIARSFGLAARLARLPEIVAEPGVYDVITLNHVIEHLHDPIESLRLCYRLLKPGGTVWLQTPNIESIGYAIFRSAWRGLEPPRHLVLFNQRSLHDALRTAGFLRPLRRPRGQYTEYVFPASEAVQTSSRPATVRLVRRASIELLETAWPARREFLTVQATRP